MTPLLEWIKVFAAIFALSSGIYGAVQAYSIIPIMQKQQQAEIDVIKGDFRQTHERLARIESNIEWIRSTLDRNKITKNDPSMVSQ
jgi:hypothetical protein